MENEEMRRIRLALEGEIKALAPDVAGQAVSSISQSLGSPSTKPDDMKRSIWALTTKKNDKVVGRPRVVQSLNFKGRNLIPDKRYYEVSWDLKPSEWLEKELKTIDDAQETIIRAYVQTDDIYVRYQILIYKQIT